MITERDEHRGWRINPASGEREPVYSDYPTEGFDMALLCKDGDVEFYQVADYANKRRIYSIFVDAEWRLSTSDRSEADAAYEKAKRGEL
ncbi:hypothetical protein [Paenibacillus dakarensis]|uniref:hypothetical protein n=1 Tax=Paenibacillus dakarensis TaxID=1527293 RepID=UPI0006D54174|nr:hypothetical protein [Paenibacillus dakarensis]